MKRPCPFSSGQEEETGASDEVARPLVSVIVPCHNAERWLEECLSSVIAQTYRPLELSVWDDCSTDGSAKILASFEAALSEAKIQFVCGRGEGSAPIGCGAAKNRAIQQSSGHFLCFLDADDVMRSRRVEAQLEVASRLGSSDHLVGCCVDREPADAQPRYTAWLNDVDGERLTLQRHCECTLAMPTWFGARELFDRVGSFSEAGQGTPEDLEWFYRHLLAGGLLAKVPEPLVMYRSHEEQQSRGVSSQSIWDLRVAHLEQSLLPSLPSFSIWSAGRDGKKLFRSLSAANRAKVVAFLDVAEGKLAAGLYYDRERKVHVPILSWKKASEKEYQPAIICVKRGLHSGFEENLASLQLTEGQSYWHFC